MIKIIVGTANYGELGPKIRHILFICKVKAGVSTDFDLKAGLNQCC